MLPSMDLAIPLGPDSQLKRTSSSGARTGSIFSSTSSTRLKRAVFAPMPRASVSTATAVKPGFFSNWRKANLRSFMVRCACLSVTALFVRRNLQVGDDAVATAPKTNGAPGSVAEFVHHQRLLRSAVDEDFYLPLLDDHLGVKPGIAIGRGFDGFLELVRLFLPKLVPGPLRRGVVLHSVRFPCRISGPKIERTEIDRIMGCRVHYPESHADEAALWWCALALGIELDGASAELESIKPDDPTVVELDGWRPILLNEFRRASVPLPSFPIGHSLQVGCEGLRAQ